MASSQKKFIVGCLLGGLVGASAALLVPRRYIDSIEGVQTKLIRNNYNKVHTTGPNSVHKTRSAPISYKKMTKAKKPSRHTK